MVFIIFVVTLFCIIVFSCVFSPLFSTPLLLDISQITIFLPTVISKHCICGGLVFTFFFMFEAVHSLTSQFLRFNSSIEPFLQQPFLNHSCTRCSRTDTLQLAPSLIMKKRSDKCRAQRISSLERFQIRLVPLEKKNRNRFSRIMLGTEKNVSKALVISVFSSSARINNECVSWCRIESGPFRMPCFRGTSSSFLFFFTSYFLLGAQGYIEWCARWVHFYPIRHKTIRYVKEAA